VADYKTDPGPDRSAIRGAARPDDFSAVERFLQLLARATLQCHTYPLDSPLCTEAITACHEALTSLEPRDRLTFRVAQHELVVDETGVGAGTMIENEITRRLRKAQVLALEVERAASERHLLRFCADLIRCEGAGPDQPAFADVLADHGVDTIVPLMAYRPAIVDVGSPAPVRSDLVTHEQRRRQELESSGPVDYLYPPDKGWVRLDPGAPLDHVSLTDLAILVENPSELAGILLRLTDEDPNASDATTTALERKFSDVAVLFAALEPKLARVMFARLANAVLTLDATRRQDLLRRTILPGLLDGQPSGVVLRDFPDGDLADSLCLLLELETAAPQVLSAALTRLELPAERRETVLPLIDRRLRHDSDEPISQQGEHNADRLARRLVRVDATPGKDFSEFAAFDLSLDAGAAAAIDKVRGAVSATDLPAVRLACLSHLLRLETSVSTAEALLRRAVALFANFSESETWDTLATWASHYRQLASDLSEQHPDVADAILKALASFFGGARALRLVELHEQPGPGREITSSLVEAFGTTAVPGLVALLDGKSSARAQAVISLLCDHATLFAPALVPDLAAADSVKQRAIVRILGHAGPGYEHAIAGQLRSDDEQTAREAIRALARIGTGQAASLVAQQLQAGPVARRAAAEESLWHFPPARAAVQLRQLLGSRDFVRQNPKTAVRLLDRAAHSGTRGLDEVLAGLEGLRFRFWNPGLVRVALKARELRVR
jgi:hypothetical protein